MGNGMFNLFMSTLPSKVLRLLEFVGFSSNKVKVLKKIKNYKKFILYFIIILYN